MYSFRVRLAQPGFFYSGAQFAIKVSGKIMTLTFSVLRNILKTKRCI